MRVNAHVCVLDILAWRCVSLQDAECLLALNSMAMWSGEQGW